MRNHVLVVGDNAEIRQAVVDAAAGRGYDLLVAATGREALEWLHNRSDPAEACVILADSLSPAVDLPGLVRAMRRNDVLATLPIAAVTRRLYVPPPSVQSIVRHLYAPISLDRIFALAEEGRRTPA